MDIVAEISAFLQILIIDLSLAGDNAIIVGTAAAGLPADQRKKAILAGIVAATVLRILFAVFAVQMLQIVGLLAAGGLLLLWVSWKMYRDIRHQRRMQAAGRDGKDGDSAGASAKGHKTLSSAIWQITLADISMSLDNVLAVAGVARDHMPMLIAGLVISVLLMGAASALIAKLAHRYPWLAYLGLAIVLYTSLHMIWDGVQPFL